jgi:PadR family transcriptional regulator AphA
VPAADDDLSLNSWAVLALLVDDGPQHGFALARTLDRGTDLGRVWSVSRPLVYRALEQLTRRGLAVAGTAEPSPSGPSRQEHAATPAGVAALERWRSAPVRHLRDVRPTLVLKLTLGRRAGRDLGPLLAAQRAVLADLAAERGPVDTGAGNPRLVVDVWRDELAHAADRTLARLQEGG